MKGYVPTPSSIVDLMVEKLFSDRPPIASSLLLDPGCGPGAFIGGVVRWCAANRRPLPRIVGVESDPRHGAEVRGSFESSKRVEIQERDFLTPSLDRYDYIIGNPPYVPITALTPTERHGYRAGYSTARGRFDLYLLFFEQALSQLKPDGRLVFITPEKFLYVDTAGPLRELLAAHQVEELHFVDEATFGDLVTYPLITVVSRSRPGPTRVIHRTGIAQVLHLPGTKASWLPSIQAARPELVSRTLADVCQRISCGVATGADSVFTIRNAHLDAGLGPFAHPTLAGRQIRRGGEPRSMHSLLVPYSLTGSLLPEGNLGALGDYLSDPTRKDKLLARTCVVRKPWYAFHETPPLEAILQPKLLCKDITAEPYFIVDRTGTIVPRHSVYYIVPNDPAELDSLAAYLNSPRAVAWLMSNCQRAAKGYVRLQSHVLKRLPVPTHLPQVSTADVEAIVA